MQNEIVLIVIMITTIKPKLENEIQNTKYAWLNNLSVVNLKASRVTTRIAEKKKRKGWENAIIVWTLGNMKS